MRFARRQTRVFSSAADALLFVKKKLTLEETLFKHSPERIQKLRRQARAENRAKQRKEWYDRNRD